MIRYRAFSQTELSHQTTRTGHWICDRWKLRRAHPRFMDMVVVMAHAVDDPNAWICRFFHGNLINACRMLWRVECRYVRVEASFWSKYMLMWPCALLGSKCLFFEGREILCTLLSAKFLPVWTYVQTNVSFCKIFIQMLKAVRYACTYMYAKVL